jgi:hypothetical protein
MWLFTKIGFFSAVEDYNDKNGLMVRARFMEDIEKLQATLKEKGYQTNIYKTPNNDYLYRLFVPKHIFANILFYITMDIDYGNFKNEVHGDPIRDEAYMECWYAMNDAQHLKNKNNGYVI